jgi:VWFA-related protein
MRNTFYSAAAIAISVVLGFAQSPAPTTSPAKNDDHVVRIGVTLVQVDAVVTDAKGNHVAGLKPEDFEVYEDGHRADITNFSYVGAVTPSLAPPISSEGVAVESNAPLPPVALKPEQVRRTIALVVDDLALSFESSVHTRQTLSKFVDEQMEPGDLVAIIRTGAGIGALQQFTSDKRLLHAAIDRVRWNPFGTRGIGAFRPVGDSGTAVGDIRSVSSDSAAADVIESRQEVFTVGSLGALRYIVQGLKELPGRKSVILFSEGYRDVFEMHDPLTLPALRSLVDAANRAAVLMYTVDPRGQVYTGPTAADSISGSTQRYERLINARSSELFETQNSLGYLADETGGFLVRNHNDLGAGVKQIVNDQANYYLIGFVPQDSTFKSDKGARSFHKITIKVKQPGLTVRYRNGFYGVSDAEIRAANLSPGQRLYQALASPFGSNDITLKLTSLFSSTPKSGSFVRSLLYIDPHKLTFADADAGWRNTTFNVVGYAFGDNGQSFGSFSKTFTARLRADRFDQEVANGLVYTINIPIKKPGAYQIRVAVQDAATSKVGSASEFVETPDVRKGRLALSGIVLRATRKSQVLNGGPAEPSPASEAASDKEGAAQEEDSSQGPAVRAFRGGSVLDVSFIVFNPKLDKTSKQPDVEAVLRILKDGKLVYAGKPQQIEGAKQIDAERFGAGGSVSLPKGMAAGSYVLQIVCTDKLADAKRQTVAQWTDFDVVK